MRSGLQRVFGHGALLAAVALSAPAWGQTTEERLHVHRFGSNYTAPYDAFQYLNRLPDAFAENDTPDTFSGRLFGRLGNQEGRMLVKIVPGYDKDTYEGYKTFSRTTGEKSVGNCIACHRPPEFTDKAYRNTGVSLTAYEKIHGPGSFSEIEIPGSESAVRPSKRLSSEPKKGEPGQADLGHWNYVDPEQSPLKNEGESHDAFLKRMIGAFPTPSLRNVAETAPYNHNEAYQTIEDVVRHKMEMSRLAKEGKAPYVDEAYKTMNITESDIPGLVKFLETLTNAAEEEFRKMVLTTDILDTSYIWDVE